MFQSEIKSKTYVYLKSLRLRVLLIGPQKKKICLHKFAFLGGQALKKRREMKALRHSNIILKTIEK